MLPLRFLILTLTLTSILTLNLTLILNLIIGFGVGKLYAFEQDGYQLRTGTYNSSLDIT